MPDDLSAGAAAPLGEGSLDERDLVEIGRLGRRHGVRGEIRLLPHNPDSATLRTGQAVAVAPSGGGTAEWMRITALRRHQKFILLRFEGVDTANDADRLVGRVLSVPRAQLPELDDGAIYHCDLIGCRVVGEGEEELGVVAEVLSTGSNDVLVVRGGEREYLIPWTDDVVAEVDTVAARIRIVPLPGLLDP